MTEHFRKVCIHGKNRGQCRCPDPNKRVILDECFASCAKETLPVIYTGTIGGTAVAAGPAGTVLPPMASADHDALIALIKRISPIKHEPLASAVAEEWAAEFEKDGWIRVQRETAWPL
jgi:hypothetical protein